MSERFFSQDTYTLVKKEYIVEVSKMLTFSMPIPIQTVYKDGVAWGYALTGKHFDFDSPEDELQAVLKYEVLMFKNGFAGVAQHLKDTSKQIICQSN
jgi:hypothetical protein